MSNLIYPNANTTPSKEQAAASTKFGSKQTDHIYLRNAIEGIPLLTMDNYPHWKGRFINMLNLQKLTKPLTNPEGVHTNHQNNQLLLAMATKLKPSVEMNITTPGNKDGTCLLWADIKEYFASEQPANKAVFIKNFGPSSSISRMYLSLSPRSKLF
ncbi:hypothetical protein KEM48_002281 [Puccinia striiformis f. sp. tritici PST-130]|nr:hypothetical protein KEM48_002281 [Puccinia striiformis f. sp. tritici PST-130]